MRKLYVDQYGNRFYASTVKELREEVREEVGGGRVSKMYRDKADETFHVGYVIGQHWLTAYAPVETPAR